MNIRDEAFNIPTSMLTLLSAIPYCYIVNSDPGTTLTSFNKIKTAKHPFTLFRKTVTVNSVQIGAVALHV